MIGDIINYNNNQHHDFANGTDINLFTFLSFDMLYSEVTETQDLFHFIL